MNSAGGRALFVGRDSIEYAPGGETRTAIAMANSASWRSMGGRFSSAWVSTVVRACIWPKQRWGYQRRFGSASRPPTKSDEITRRTCGRLVTGKPRATRGIGCGKQQNAKD